MIKGSADPSSAHHFAWGSQKEKGKKRTMEEKEEETCACC